MGFVSDSTGAWIDAPYLTVKLNGSTTSANSMTYTATATSTRSANWLFSDSSTATVSLSETPDEYRSRVRGLQQRCEKELANPTLAPAYHKAEQWLLEYLSSEQRRTFEADKFFEVIGGKSGKRYRIRRGLSGVHNVDELNAAGDIARTLCFLPNGDLPEGDILLTQKVLLETDETYAIGMANQVPRFA